MTTDTSNLDPVMEDITRGFLAQYGAAIGKASATPILDALNAPMDAIHQARIEALQSELETVRREKNELAATVDKLVREIASVRHANSGLSELIGHQRDELTLRRRAECARGVEATYPRMIVGPVQESK